MTRRAPSVRNRRAAARPRPDVPPTIRQRLSRSRMESVTRRRLLARVERPQTAGVLGVEVFQLFLDRLAAGYLVARQKDYLDVALDQSMRHLAAEHVHQHRAADRAEWPSLLAGPQRQERVAHGGAVVENH